MSLIPVDIQPDEILVRFVFDGNFKRKVVEDVNLIIKDLFLPNRGGVSLQRGNFVSENKCKLIATSVFNDRSFSGFVIFTKQKFDEIKTKYVEENRPEFEALILSTPIDPIGRYIAVNRLGIEVDDNCNYGHSDLIYLNPAMRKEESVNTAIRSFSRKLSKTCIFIKDQGISNEIFQGTQFKDAI